MQRAILRVLVACAASFALLAGCDKVTSSNGGGTDTPVRTDSVSAATTTTWIRTVGNAVETLTLGPDGKATLDSLTTIGSVTTGARYTGTWSGTSSSFSVTWSGYATTADGTAWSALVTLPSMTAYPFTVSGTTATVVVNGVARTYTKGAGTPPIVDPAAPAAPVITPAGGTFPNTQGVQIASSTQGAEVYFTLDGSTPTAASSKYTGSIPVSSTRTIKAIAIKDGKTSSVAMATIVIGTVDKPPVKGIDTALAGAWMNLNVATMAGKSYQLDSSGQAIFVQSEGTGKTSVMYMGTWSAANGSLSITWAMAMSSTDGQNFSTSIPVPGPFQATYTITGSTLRLVAGATTTEFQRATVRNPQTLSEPTFTPDGGSFSSTQTVAIAGPSGARIHYTTDGSDPDENSPLYSSPITIAKTTTVKAIAIDDDGESGIASAMFVVATGPLTRDPAVVGSWKSVTDSQSMVFTFRADGTYSGSLSLTVPGITYFARQSGTWSTDQGQLTTIQLTSEMSQNGTSWMDEPDFTPETQVIDYSVSASGMRIQVDGDELSLTRFVP